MIYKYLKNSVLAFLIPFVLSAQNRNTISGFVKEEGSLEQMIGVSIVVVGKNIGTQTNTYGFYSISLPQDTKEVTLRFSFVGYEAQEKKVVIDKSQELNVQLKHLGNLDEVVVSAKRQADRVSENVQMSKIEVPIAQMLKVPTLLGEKDVMRVLQLMPGVQKGSEGQTGIYVRGGGPDQNLIILDDAPVYNANHLFGFFSVFNGDALKSVELTKGGFPARYGGRLSSVIDLNMKDGNKTKLSGQGGIGLISSRLTLEGPILKNRASFLVSARRTYIDVLAKPLIMRAQKNQSEKVDPGYYFYDLNAKFNVDINQKNKLYLSGYFGQDRFKANTSSINDTLNNGLNWGNATTTFRWNHLYNAKLFSNLSLIFTDYKFKIYSENRDSFGNSSNVFKLDYRSAIRDFGFKYDFDYFPSPTHAIKIGLQSTFHLFNPSALVIQDNKAKFNRTQVPVEALESGIYAEDTWSPTGKLKVNMGVRLSNYQVIEKTYWRPEPRIAIAYKAAEDLSLKASYAQMNQYVHLLSNTGLGLPTDLWVPTTVKVGPQNSEQTAAGIAKDFGQSGISLTLEGYYKRMNQIISYKEGSSFMFLDDPTAIASTPSWENNITTGRGTSYGTEVLLQKKQGKFSGWAGYTLSWTKWQFAELNFGQPFFPKFDRRHDASLVGIYELNKRITISGSWVYGTGNALTIPVARYPSMLMGNYNVFSENGQVKLPLQNQYFSPFVDAQEYGPKNSFRAEPYHRLDLSVQLHKKLKHHERTWEFSAYNAYNRRNPFFYSVTTKYSDNGRTQNTSLKRYSVFPIVPSVSYNFKF